MPEPTNSQDPYQFCPSVPVVPPPHEIIFSSSGIPQPKLQCKKCDLRLTEDGKAIVVECFQCYDIPTTTREANKTERNILYKVYFLEIANYTTVEVVGAENFDLIN
nr:unnamed protein product [Callosobruchus chinensis]